MQLIRQWLIPYLRAKDAVHKNIANLTEDAENADVVVELKTGTKKYYFIRPKLSAEEAANLAQGKEAVIVTMNTKDNLNILITAWQKLLVPKLSIVFVNPDSVGEKQWTVYPAVHDRVTEKESLRRGLESMAAMVEQCKVNS